MTRTTNARIAGFTFLFYIAVGVTSLVLSNRAISGEGIASKLASIAQHASLVRVDILLTLLQAGCALVLAVTLYALTHDQDRDLAVMALCCRVGEGLVIAAVSSLVSFAVGSTLFSYLLLRGRMIPIPLAWLGVFASILVVVLLPAQLAGFKIGSFSGLVGWLMWLPLLVFEVVLALWLLIKGVAAPATR